MASLLSVAPSVQEALTAALDAITTSPTAPEFDLSPEAVERAASEHAAGALPGCEGWRKSQSLLGSYRRLYFRHCEALGRIEGLEHALERLRIELEGIYRARELDAALTWEQPAPMTSSGLQRLVKSE
jgi:hypothetical protein